MSFEINKSMNMKRRNFIQMASGAALAGSSFAAEGGGKWNGENRAEYNNLLFAWLRQNFQGRAEMLSRHLKEPFEIRYEYLNVSGEAKRQRFFDKYAAGRVGGKEADGHVTECLADFERVRVLLAAAETKAEPEWKYEGGNVFVKEGKIYELEVSAERLTVVLDVSPSMRPYLDKLRIEIGRDFPQTHFVEVNGCQFEDPPQAPWFFCGHSPLMNPFKANRHIPLVPRLEDAPYSQYLGWTLDCPGAIECMVDLMESDAIYWFCDFDDPTDDKVIISTARKILAAKTKLLVHTLAKRPPKLLVELAERSGGEVIRKRI
jgi:hypothetical protein